jgi:hypothetical protein
VRVAKAGGVPVSSIKLSAIATVKRLADKIRLSKRMPEAAVTIEFWYSENIIGCWQLLYAGEIKCKNFPKFISKM